MRKKKKLNEKADQVFVAGPVDSGRTRSRESGQCWPRHRPCKCDWQPAWSRPSPSRSFALWVMEHSDWFLRSSPRSRRQESKLRGGKVDRDWVLMFWPLFPVRVWCRRLPSRPAVCRISGRIKEPKRRKLNRNVPLDQG